LNESGTDIEMPDLLVSSWQTGGAPAEADRGTETSAAEASGPMKESMETMKKAWKDASSTPEGAGHAAGPLVAYGDRFMGGVFVGASDAVPNGRLYLATEVGVFEQGGGDLNDWQSHYGSGGWAAASGGGGDDLLIGGLTGFEPLPGQFPGFELV
jgi:hypothetical protein